VPSVVTAALGSNWYRPGLAVVLRRSLAPNAPRSSGGLGRQVGGMGASKPGRAHAFQIGSQT
jgi:hypothetical protein